MKIKILLLIISSSFILSTLYAQRSTKKITGYAITAPQKGEMGWREVRLVDVKTGEELQTIYKATDETAALNARTGKPVVKKDKQQELATAQLKRKIVNLDQELNNHPKPDNVRITTHQEIDKKLMELNLNNLNQVEAIKTNKRVTILVKDDRHSRQLSYDKPFATNSAAMAYDKKHERLYYTPMNINQLRYIDLKDKTSKIYYFEDEPFGAVTGKGDVHNQITRMVIASDGNGYALSNDGNHLVKFTTGKKPTITDLGSLTDDAKNGANSIHNPGGFGGDLIADFSENLYLVTANRNVFKISIDNKTASYLGSIKGLPKGFSTNGAMVEEGSKVIVASSQSTAGYYRFDLNTLVAEKVSGETAVFNASDLANGNLAKLKKDKTKEETTPAVTEELVSSKNKNNQAIEQAFNKGIAVYPNPVTNGAVKISFSEQPAGKYQMELFDISGRLIKAKEVNIMNSMHVEEFRTPELNVKGNYLLKVTNAESKLSVTNKLQVQ